MRGFLSPGVDSDDWTVLGVLAAAARSVRREPVATLVWVGLVPALWSGVLFDWLWSHVVGGGPPFAVEVSDIAPTVLRALAASAWTSFLIGGQYVLAIDVARGNAPRVARFLRGFRFAIPVFLTASAFSLAQTPFFLVLALLRIAPVAASVLGLLVVPVSLVVVVRTAVSIPLVVDRGKSVRAALRGSWELTNGQSWKIARLLLLYVPFVFLLAIIHGVPAGEVIALGSLQCFGTLTTVHLYLCLTKPAANTPVVSLPVVDDLPVRGSGWAKSVEPGEG